MLCGLRVSVVKSRGRSKPGHPKQEARNPKQARKANDRNAKRTQSAADADADRGRRLRQTNPIRAGRRPGVREAVLSNEPNFRPMPPRSVEAGCAKRTQFAPDADPTSEGRLFQTNPI